MNAATQLATAILAAARIYEESVDKEKVARLRAQSEQGHFVDFSTIHTKSLSASCDEADEELSQPVFFLLHNSWNDALDWAKNTVDGDQENAEFAEARRAHCWEFTNKETAAITGLHGVERQHAARKFAKSFGAQLKKRMRLIGVDSETLIKYSGVTENEFDRVVSGKIHINERELRIAVDKKLFQLEWRHQKSQAQSQEE